MVASVKQEGAISSSPIDATGAARVMLERAFPQAGQQAQVEQPGAQGEPVADAQGVAQNTAVPVVDGQPVYSDIALADYMAKQAARQKFGDATRSDAETQHTGMIEEGIQPELEHTTAAIPEENVVEFEQNDGTIETETGKKGKNVNTSFSEIINSELSKYGISLNEFNKLRLKDVSSLTKSEKVMLKAIRESIPMPSADTMMQKVIPAGDIMKYLNGSYTGVRGYVTRAQDVMQLSTYDDFYDCLRLDYPNSPYNRESDISIGVIRYTSNEISKILIPYNLDMGGNVIGAPPFTGNGFTGALNGQIIPEYQCSSTVVLSDGAQLYEVGRDGVETLRGVYSAVEGRFIPV